MDIYEFLHVCSHPVEDIPLSIYQEYVERHSYLSPSCPGIFDFTYDNDGIEISKKVKCVERYYTLDPTRKKKIHVKNCLEIQKLLFNTNCCDMYGQCIECHRQCLEKVKNKELYFIYKTNKNKRRLLKK